MVKNQLPFRFYEVSAVHPEPFQVGGTVSVFDLCGVYLCCEGEVCFSSDDHTYTMHRGDLYIYLPSSVVHLKQLSADSRGLVMDARIDFALPISNKVMNSGNLLCLRQHPTLHLTDEQFDYLQRLMLRIGKRIQWEEVRELPVARQHLMMELMKSLGHVVFYEVLNLYFASEVKDPVPNDRKDLICQNFMLSLYQYYQKERDVAFYAELQHITPRYFSSIIKEKSGQTASRWIVQLVIAEAKRSLESTDLSIKEVAAMLNFPNQSFFGKYFKQHVGMSPNDYRRDSKYQ